MKRMIRHMNSLLNHLQKPRDLPLVLQMRTALLLYGLDHGMKNLGFL